jgi:putative FmdB family regulatory protein
MPTYEYICTKCNHQFEKYQSIADDSLAVCPKDNCGRKRWGKGKVKRVIGAGAGLLFKGSGFYITDYRSESYKSAAKTDAPASSTTAAAESKPSGNGTAAASKPETKPQPKKETQKD